MSEATTLPNDPALLKQMISELLEQLQASRRAEELLQHQVQALLRKLFGSKSEKIHPDQLSLPDLEGLGAPTAQEPAEESAEPQEKDSTKRRAKRRRPPKELPRRRLEYPLPEEERLCPCCQVPMSPMREEVHEQLDYRPALFEVVEHVRFVYGCRQGCDEAVETASKPPQLIEKGLPGSGLLAHIVTSKYADHQPLYRLEGIFRRQGVEIPRSTMCDWIGVVSDRLEPLYNHLKEDILRSHVLATDDTPVKVLDPGNKGTYKGRLWVYVGDDEHPWIVFDYTPTRERDGPQRFLEPFEGYLQADAYAGYDELYATRNILEVGCWMHARRYFYEASQADPSRPCEALAMVRELYRIERACADLDPEQRQKARENKAGKILDAFEEWIDKQAAKTLPKSPLGKALTYATNQWQALRRYTKDGRIPIDNGRSERALRGVAIGRKNWLFAGSDAGGQRAARIYTLIATCRRQHIDPFHYLWDLFQRLPEHPQERIQELTPMAWKAEQQR